MKTRQNFIRSSSGAMIAIPGISREPSPTTVKEPDETSDVRRQRKRPRHCQTDKTTARPWP